MLSRLYPAEPEGHCEDNMSVTPDWRTSPRRTPPEGHNRFPAGTKTPTRTYYLLDRVRLCHGGDLVDEAGIEMILVGDSLAQTMLGYENTLSVTVDEMLHHGEGGAARRKECAAAGGYALRILSDRLRRRAAQCPRAL